MNNGDSKEEIKRQNEEEAEEEGRRKREIERANPDDYGRAVSKMAVAQICEGVGFEAFKKSTMEALSDIMVRFISDLGKSATFYANLGGRSESNVFDIIKGLQDLGVCSNSTISSSNCAISYEIVKEMSDFVSVVEENPFAYPIPEFPIPVKKNKGFFAPSFLQMGENPGGKHIPDWLPAFPDPHTYMHSPLWNQRKLELRIDKGEQARQRRKAERSLLNLQQRLLSHDLAGPSGFHGEKEKYPMEDNPPLPPRKGKENGGGERKQVLVKEMFAPVIDALKGGDNGGESDSDATEIDRRVIPVPVPAPAPVPAPVSSKRRPFVHFKMKAGKKMLVKDLDIHLWSMVNDKRGSLFGRDDDKDDKKRRAEFILRQSAIDNPQEVSQM